MRFAQRGRQNGDDAGRDAQSQGQPDLRNAGVKPAPLRWRIFERHENGASPLAAEADALHDAKAEKKDGGRDADLSIGRQQTDEEGRNAHEHQRQDQHALATDPIAEVTEDDAADRTGDEADSEGRVG